MKINKLIVILIALNISIFTFNCITNFSIRKTNTELENYVGIFKDEMDQRGLTDLNYDDINVAFSPILYLEHDVAESYALGKIRYITILKAYFVRASPEVREAVVLHELGHVFGLDHLDSYGYFNDGSKCAMSVMHSYDAMRGCFSSHRVYYYTEIANRIKAIDKRNNF